MLGIKLAIDEEAKMCLSDVDNKNTQVKPLDHQLVMNSLENFTH